METKTSMGRGKGLLNSAKWHRIQQVVRTNPLETPITSLVQVLNHLITELPNTSKSTSDKAEALAQLQAVLKLAIEHPAESEFLATLLHYTGHAAYVDGYTRGCTEAARE